MHEGEGDFALWGGRFESPLSPEAAALNRSLPMDVRLWREELEIDRAWAEALVGAGVLTPAERDAILVGLDRVGERIAQGAAEGAPDEDVHTLVERLLGDVVADVAGKLRTGRSRNDVAATATRLWTLRAVRTLDVDVRGLQAALLHRAEATVDVLMPAYTHLRRAQPVRMAQWWLSHFWPLLRDRARLAHALEHASVLPLGAGAAAGSGFAVDREFLRVKLGFAAVAPNSLDAVSDRDFIAEVAFAGALLGVHLSRLAEDLILFSSAEFGFLTFADAYSTGSSIMPQKRNPDVAELARGKSARLLADVSAILTLLKGLPTGYNKDLQEDKAVLFDVCDSLHLTLPALAGAVETLVVNREALSRALEPSLLATDVADALVRSGLTFHAAHEVVGRLVRAADRKGVSILEVTREEARTLHPSLPAALASLEDARGAGDYEASVEARAVAGGTAREAVRAQIEAARAAIGR